jgi:hypothetical protein
MVSPKKKKSVFKILKFLKKSQGILLSFLLGEYLFKKCKNSKKKFKIFEIFP